MIIILHIFTYYTRCRSIYMYMTFTLQLFGVNPNDFGCDPPKIVACYGAHAVVGSIQFIHGSYILPDQPRKQ